MSRRIVLKGLSLEKRRIVAVLCVITIALALSSYYFWIWLPSIQPESSSYQNVTVQQAKELIKANPSLLILDVRNQTEFDSGYIDGARCIPVSELQQRLGELDRKAQILVYCAMGGRSALASNILINNGFQHVYNMLGGIEAWKQLGNTVVWCHCEPHWIK